MNWGLSKSHFRLPDGRLGLFPLGAAEPGVDVSGLTLPDLKALAPNHGLGRLWQVRGFALVLLLTSVVVMMTASFLVDELPVADRVPAFALYAGLTVLLFLLACGLSMWSTRAFRTRLALLPLQALPRLSDSPFRRPVRQVRGSWRLATGAWLAIAGLLAWAPTLTTQLDEFFVLPVIIAVIWSGAILMSWRYSLELPND